MEIVDLKTIIHLASNVSFDFELPAYKVLQKTQVNSLFIHYDI